jgi:hypothetical protein
MNKNGIKRIPLNLNVLNQNINSDFINTNNTESPKNKGIQRTESNKNSINSSKKKKKVCFIDQLYNKADIAQIIYINDKVSLDEDKADSNRYLELYRKQSTNIDERNKKSNNDNINTNEDIYRIKRPKKSLFNKIRKEDMVNEQCTCIIF